MTARPTSAHRGDVPTLRVLLRRPLLVGLAALSVVAVTTVALAVVVVTVLGSRVDRANHLLGDLQDAHVAMLDQETGLRGFLVTRQERFLQPYYVGASALARSTVALEESAEADPAVAGEVARLRAAQQRWLDGWVRPMLVWQPPVDDGAALATLVEQGKALFDPYRAVEAEVRAAVEERRERAETLGDWVVLGGAGLFVVVVVAVGTGVWRAHRRVTGALAPPIDRVRSTLADLAAGDLDSCMVPRGPAELRVIAQDVNVLGSALRQHEETVAARERELVDARDQAERAGQARAAFLATMSHEIRTPLNAVLGLTDVLLTTELTDDQRSHLETIAGSGDSLLAVINDILDFSKIEAGELELKQAPFDLPGVLYDVARLLAPQAAGKGLDLLVDVDADCPQEVVGDSVRLRQVVLNLVSNALKFTTQGEVVVGLSARREGSALRCRISVTDTGIGIPVAQQERLFRAFSQVDASTTRRYGGTGLGLAISRRITEAMGGDIDVVSIPGEGSTFTATVRLRPGAGAGDPGGRPGLAGRRLLLVDDNPTNLRILEQQLTRAGAECVLAGGGAEALELLARGPAFDAGLLDLRMPDIDGAELARLLRAGPATAALPLVLLSSSPSAPAADGLFAARLHKPVRPERLVTTLRSVLRTAAPGAGRPAAPAPDDDRTDRPLRVLVAEDNDVNAQLVGLYLDRLGHRSDRVADGRQAIEAVRTGAYDVVLMDAQMPVLGGVDATAAIRALPVRQPRVLALTAGVLASDRAAFLDAGADDFLTKPLRIGTLRAALEACVPSGDVPARATAVADVLDAEVVEEIRGLGEQSFDELYAGYADSLSAALAALDAAAAGAEVPAVGPGSVPGLAHRLKGSSATMGALRLAELCGQVEHAGAPGDRDRALLELQEESARVQDAVRALLRGMG